MLASGADERHRSAYAAPRNINRHAKQDSVGDLSARLVPHAGCADTTIANLVIAFLSMSLADEIFVHARAYRPKVAIAALSLGLGPKNGSFHNCVSEKESAQLSGGRGLGARAHKALAPGGIPVRQMDIVG